MLYLEGVAVLNGKGRATTPYCEEDTMAEPSPDPKTPKTDGEKKQPETVLLSAEELRKIAGGGLSGVPTPLRAQSSIPATPTTPTATGH